MKTLTLTTNEPLDLEAIEAGNETTVKGVVQALQFGAPLKHAHSFEATCEYDIASDAWLFGDDAFGFTLKEQTGEILQDGKTYRVTIEEVES